MVQVLTLIVLETQSAVHGQESMVGRLQQINFVLKLMYRLGITICRVPPLINPQFCSPFRPSIFPSTHRSIGLPASPAQAQRIP